MLLARFQEPINESGDQINRSFGSIRGGPTNRIRFWSASSPTSLRNSSKSSRTALSTHCPSRYRETLYLSPSTAEIRISNMAFSFHRDSASHSPSFRKVCRKNRRQIGEGHKSLFKTIK